jgi:hypothetical protein
VNAGQSVTVIDTLVSLSWVVAWVLLLPIAVFRLTVVVASCD